MKATFSPINWSLIVSLCFYHCRNRSSSSRLPNKTILKGCMQKVLILISRDTDFYQNRGIEFTTTLYFLRFQVEPYLLSVAETRLF